MENPMNKLETTSTRKVTHDAGTTNAAALTDPNATGRVSWTATDSAGAQPTPDAGPPGSGKDDTVRRLIHRLTVWMGLLGKDDTVRRL
jgi:hypothetical protein